MRRLKMGFVGYGRWSSGYHARTMHELQDRYELVGVCDITPARRKAASDELGIPTYDTLESFLSSDVELVLVAAPTSAHAEIARRVVAAGKHTIVEKPMGMTYAELEPLIDEARTKGVMLTGHHNRRWDPDFRTVRSIIDEGQIGDVLVVESNSSGMGSPHTFGTADYHPTWRIEREYGGGKLNEWGSHFIDQALQMFGYDIDYVWGELRNEGLSDEVDTYGTYAIKFTSGVLFQIETSWISPFKERRWYALGTKGALLKHELNKEEPVQVRVNSDDGNNDIEVPCVESQHQDYYRELYDAVVSGGKPPVSAEEAGFVVRVIEAIRASSREKRVVRFS